MTIQIKQSATGLAQKLGFGLLVQLMLVAFSTITVEAEKSQVEQILESARKNAKSNRHCEIALKEAQQVITIQPTLVEAYLIKAECEDYLIGADAAIATLRSALNRNLQTEDLWKMLGTLYDAKRNYELAVQAYTKALALNPRDAGVLHLRGMAYTELKKTDLAIEDMTKCIAIDPERSAFYEWRAFAYEQKQKWNESLADLNKAIALANSVNKTRYLSHRADAYVKLNKQKEAINDYDTLLKFNSMDDTFWLKRGDCYMALGNFKEAVKNYTETISLGDSSTAYYARSKAYQKLGLTDLANKDKATGDQLLKGKAVTPI